MKSYTSFHPQTMPWDGVAASLLLSSNQTICLIADQGLRIAIERSLLCVVVFRAKEAT